MSWGLQFFDLVTMCHTSTQVAGIPGCQAGRIEIPGQTLEDMGCGNSTPQQAGAHGAADASASATPKVFTLAEVRQHRSMNDCWVAVDGFVYRLPLQFLRQHPGGMEAILASAGTDATRLFNNVHSVHAKRRLQTFCIGKLEAPPAKVSEARSNSEAAGDAGEPQPGNAAKQASAQQSLPKAVTKQEQQQQEQQHNSLAAGWTVAEAEDQAPAALSSAKPEQPGGAEAADAVTVFTDTSFTVLSTEPSPPQGWLAEPLALPVPAPQAASMPAGAATPPAHAKAPAAADALHLTAPTTLQGPTVRLELPLSQRTQVTHNTLVLRFALPSPQHRLGLPCGHHVRLSTEIDGENVARPYTPVSDDTDIGFVDILVKVYYANTHPDYPEGGRLSQYLNTLPLGAKMTFTGPTGKFHYQGRGVFSRLSTPGFARHLSMVAGGTGITPLYAVMRAVLRDPGDATTMSLIFANLTEEDILLRAELELLAALHPERLKLYFVLASPPEGWTQGRSMVTTELMAERLFPPGPETLGLMCGPSGLMEQVCIPGYRAMGYSSDVVVRF